jgi:hypothetical protein
MVEKKERVRKERRVALGCDAAHHVFFFFVVLDMMIDEANIWKEKNFKSLVEKSQLIQFMSAIYRIDVMHK